MKNILVYGDSITWGRIPGEAGRYDENTRYSSVTQNELGDDYLVLSEGLRARTMAGENPFFQNRDGLAQFGPIFASHLPLDLLIIFLGTNDINRKLNKSSEEIVGAIDSYIENLRSWCKDFEVQEPKLLIISPPLVKENQLKEESMFTGAAVKSSEFAKVYSIKAQNIGADFFDAALHVETSGVDGVHLDINNNRILGVALAKKIKEILG